MANEATFSVSNERGEQLRSLARYHRTPVQELVETWIDRALADAGLNAPEPAPSAMSIEEMLGDLEFGSDDVNDAAIETVSELDAI